VVHAQGEGVVALGESLKRLVHRRLGVTRHRQQLLFENVQFHVEMFHNFNLIPAVRISIYCAIIANNCKPD